MNSTPNANNTKVVFTKYEIFMIAILSILQFSVILDFMILSPLGYIVMPALKITPSQFGTVVGGYAISACISGFLVAGFADKFDRKKLLMFFYVGFVIGTAFCAVAQSYEMLLGARIFTGIFGGVIGSIGFAIITDLFKIEARGRVMGFAQMSFAASQILGIPAGLFIARHWDWHFTFWMIVIFSTVVGIVIALYMKPITEHLKYKSGRNPLQHLAKTFTNSQYAKGYLATAFLATGGFMLMPFGSAFSTNNLKISPDDVILMFTVTGISSVIMGPIIGKFSDKIGKYKTFVIGSVISFMMVGIYTNLGPSELWFVILMNVLLFVGITTRMISSQALTSALPQPQDRGAFMSINSSVMQFSGGIAATIAGKIVSQGPNNELIHYNTLGYVVMGSIVLGIILFYILNEQVQKNLHTTKI
ncbi:MAG TPA: MFS transporter [Cytophagaceae bacterium]|jgi:predicted MFS family arabinose efflux permease|nr:MFS transporter [Cytophagaceae bacterium]